MSTLFLIVTIGIVLWMVIGTFRVMGRDNDGFWDGFWAFMMIDLLIDLIGALLEDLDI